jgi:HNH endonuclease
MPAVCTMNNCARPTRTRGLCDAHYKRLWRYGDPSVVLLRRDLSESDRFWTKVTKTRGCWLWTACLTPCGYGMFETRRRTRLAHRWSYAAAYGPIPDGLYVLHHCDTPECVRPNHLYLGTQTDNMADMKRRGRSLKGRTRK